MADWATKLGLSLGGDSEEAYQEGRYTGAKTEAALAEARERVDKNAANARAEADFVAAGVPRNVARAAATAQQAGGSFEDPIKVLTGNQNYDFNNRIVDPATPIDTIQRIIATRATSPFEQFYKVGGGYGNKMNSEAGITPLGDSLGTDGGGQSAALQLIHEIETRERVARGDPSFKLSPAQAMGIARETQKVTDIGGVPGVVDLMASLGLSGWDHGLPNRPPAGGAPGVAPVAAPAAAPTAPTAAPIASVDQVASNKGQIAAATEQGQAQGRNAAGLQSSLATIDKFEQDIDRFLGQPGFDNLYGNIQGTDVGKMVGGVLDQDTANARADFDTLGGEAFLASIQKMRGFGQLSNQEGIKVQTALTRALDSRIGSPEARAAWAEVKKHMAELKRIAAIEAGQNQNGAPNAAAAAAPAGETKMIGNRKFVKVNGQWMEDDGT